MPAGIATGPRATGRKPRASLSSSTLLIRCRQEARRLRQAFFADATEQADEETESNFDRATTGRVANRAV